MTGDAGVRRTGKPGRRWSFLWILAATLLVCACDPLPQPGEIGVGEFSAYTGLTAGAVGTHPVLGATSGLSFSKYFIGLFDVSYARLGDDNLRYYAGLIASDSRLYDINFSVHIPVPVTERWAPYAILSPGLLYNTYQAQFRQSGTITAVVSKHDSRFGFATGAGARYYLGENWGLRGEYRYVFSSRNFSRISGGVFYQFESGLTFRSRIIRCVWR